MYLLPNLYNRTKTVSILCKLVISDNKSLLKTGASSCQLCLVLWICKAIVFMLELVLSFASTSVIG